jgi:hypothetical protein
MNTQKLNSSTALTPPAAAAKPDPAKPALGIQVDGVPVATAAATKPAKTMSAPGPGEKCELCGHTRAESDDQEEYVAAAPARPAPHAQAEPAYSVEDATETAQICQIAQAPQLASGFIAAKTSIAKVRATLAQRAADAADAAAIDPTAPPGGSAEAAVASQWDAIVGKINAENAPRTRR